MTTATIDTRDLLEISEKTSTVKPFKNRVQFDIPPRSMERLNALKLKTEASSYAEVIKNALRLYAVLIEETEDGKTFYTKEKDGKYTPYRMFV